MAEDFSAVDRGQNLKCSLWAGSGVVRTVAYSPLPTLFVVTDSDPA